MLGLKVALYYYLNLNFIYKYRIIVIVKRQCELFTNGIAYIKRQLTTNKLSFENNQATMAKSQYQRNYLTGFIMSMHFNFYLSLFIGAIARSCQNEKEKKDKC